MNVPLLALQRQGNHSYVFKVTPRGPLAEVLALLGYYSAVAMAMKLHRVPVPA